ncbi:leucyl/phenylalanyl-tRNA--protein transferase [Defluviimonas sp. 20V17]|uniref:Leucyl/phenylalanyl-tRNA--protein transferase n=1 Tax=Allgaiera indica TaxID=765699 RepID=A0AAN5A029_9RHOB|nr:leucyl/phenylalanyl-tRNA--protein transferase [Allgaiera indica]KDB05513.1 leucyl/phenylalanyl-tRNA--protein transferase [Defluviimonas sp. 20V17]GHE03503.1 leucyl/phenylalanyl-tRNA--protein transferase [Allgaiera indica]SDX43178.1 leucyl/phenylalanyl-tRNA--protein transferase [Allgaiera indica]
MRGLTPEMLLNAYAIGIFPMAQSRDSTELQWIDPRQRGIFPMQNFHISRSLRRKILRRPFQITADTDFAGVMAGCADRPETWINPEIETLTRALHRAGHAHSLEVWDGAELVGGVYGVTLGAAFFGESMFSRRPDGSKIALAYLMHRLRVGGFTLFDTQFLTDHLASLGAIEIPRAAYRTLLAEALRRRADFNALRGEPVPQDVVQRSSQTS